MKWYVKFFSYCMESSIVKGSVTNLDTIHLYLKFKLEILELPILERLDESSWAFVFLLVFMADSVHWIVKARFEKIQYFGRVFRECECYLEKNGYRIVEIENIDSHSENDES